MLVDGFVGAVGEIGQLAILYPLDTIKVGLRCPEICTTFVYKLDNYSTEVCSIAILV